MKKESYSFSAVALDLFGLAGVDPDRVNRAIQRRVARGDDAWLRPGHYHPARVRRATGTPLRMVSRERRHLRMRIENSSPLWRYEEHGREACWLVVPGRFPETTLLALIGRPLSDLAGPLPCLGGRRIGRACVDGNMTLVEFDVEWFRRG